MTPLGTVIASVVFAFSPILIGSVVQFFSKDCTAHQEFFWLMIFTIPIGGIALVVALTDIIPFLGYALILVIALCVLYVAMKMLSAICSLFIEAVREQMKK